MNVLVCSSDITQSSEGYPICADGWASISQEQLSNELGVSPMSPEDFDYLSGEIIFLFVIAAGIKILKTIFTQPVRN